MSRLMNPKQSKRDEDMMHDVAKWYGKTLENRKMDTFLQVLPEIKERTLSSTKAIFGDEQGIYQHDARFDVTACIEIVKEYALCHE